MSINDLKGEFLRGPENRRQLTVPEKARLSIVTLACQPAYTHPWAQEITVEQNQQKAARAVDQLYGQTTITQEGPVRDRAVAEDAINNAINLPGQSKIPGETQQLMQPIHESTIENIDLIRAAIEDARAQQSS